MMRIYPDENGWRVEGADDQLFASRQEAEEYARSVAGGQPARAEAAPEGPGPIDLTPPTREAPRREQLAPVSRDIGVQAGTAAVRGIGGWVGDVSRAWQENPVTGLLLAPMFGASAPFLLPASPRQSEAAMPTQDAAEDEPPPPIDFGAQGNQMPAGFEDYRNEILARIEALAPDTIQAPTLPDYPEQTVDPSLEVLANRATVRDKQFQGMLEEEMIDLRREDPTARNRWARLGEFLSQWAATGRPEMAGAVMSDILQRDRGMARELRREIMRLQMAGMQSQDAAIAAQANLLSGQHQARQATEAGQFGVDTQEAVLGHQTQIANIEAGSRARQVQSSLAADLARSAYEAAQQQNERRLQALTGLLGTPQGGAIAGQLATESGLGPEAAGLYSRTLEQEQIQQSLMALTASMNENQFRRLVRQVAPELVPLIRTRPREAIVWQLSRRPGARQWLESQGLLGLRLPAPAE